ncbi:NnrS family protein [Piscinibacter sp.]|uniref:NnrS family protein n=1 Tax=Piscinibacter sp. TaxID=1903157 RepID=UPI002CC45E29|nr:NnrS family protein [Albitalea sp.]HUG21923.1 NnrS family protein [Albitalea sp.]
MTQFISIEEPERPASAPAGFALWQLGFRPFYLLASAFAALSIALWAAQFAGWLGTPYLAGPLWHGHEMLFGFTLAVVVGFLFTAGGNWSNRPTPTGPALAAMAALWLAGRVLVLTPFGWAAAVVNTAFPVAAAVALAIPFWASRNKRNYFFVGLLLLMGAANLGIHLSQLGVVDLPAWLGVQVALDVVLFIMAVMGGRVIPMFTNNGIPGAGAVRDARVEKAALGSVLVLLAVDLLQLQGIALVVAALACAAAHALRLSLWKPWRTLRTPLVWVLHAAYFWIPLHLALRAAAEVGWIAPSLATHALTVGAIGGLIIGMMTRTARGHTARPMRADSVDVACYVLVLLAALVRVGVPLVQPTWWMHAVVASASLWSAGFALYALGYWPVLTRPRLDGKPG